MNTIQLISVFVAIGIVAAVSLAYVFPQQEHYSLEIEGM